MYFFFTETESHRVSMASIAYGAEDEPDLQILLPSPPSLRL